MLLPIFLGFFLSHAVLIVLGIGLTSDRDADAPAGYDQETRQLAGELGWVSVVSLFLRAYSLGGGTYTGIEAVSNNVQSLAEPRVLTGQWTMFYMAVSLSVHGGRHHPALPPVGRPARRRPHAQRRHVRAPSSPSLGDRPANWADLTAVLALEAGLLLVAANTGFLGGPAVLANMATDSWMPRQFLNLSSRLVTQNGVVVMGAAAILVLLATRGQVSVLWSSTASTCS